MRTLRAELTRTATRGNGGLLALMAALAGFAMAKAGPQGHSPLQGFQDASIFLATFLMGRAAVVAAGDYRSGTLRPWLISRPGRLGMFLGKLASSLVIAVGAGLVLLGGGWLATLVVRPAAPPAAMGTVTWQFLLACVALTLFGHATGVLTRSVPVALTVTLAWILPVEAVLAGSVTHADHWLPGLLLRSVTDGVVPHGMTTLGVLGHTLVPFLVLEVAAVVSFLKRDVAC